MLWCTNLKFCTLPFVIYLMLVFDNLKLVIDERLFYEGL
jgi:hypothetical protein